MTTFGPDAVTGSTGEGFCDTPSSVRAIGETTSTTQPWNRRPTKRPVTSTRHNHQAEAHCAASRPTTAAT